MKWKVYITDVSFPDVDLEQKEMETIDATLVRLNCKTAQDVIQQCGDADALLVQYAPITEEVLKCLKHLKAVSRYGIGVDMIDVPAATRHGVLVCNVPDYCIEEVAIHALTMMLYWARKLSVYKDEIKYKRWNLTEVDAARQIRRLHGQILGLVGAGRIAQELARLAISLGMRVIYYDPYVSTKLSSQMQPVSFNELVQTSDFISLHCSLTDETRGMFNEAVFQKMKPSAVLINASRGAVVNNCDLNKALRKGWIAGAGVDNLEKEPPDWEDPLLTAPNLVVTPHVAFYSDEALQDLQRLTARAIADVYRGEAPVGLLNSELFPQFLQRMKNHE